MQEYIQEKGQRSNRNPYNNNNNCNTPVDNNGEDVFLNILKINQDGL